MMNRAYFFRDIKSLTELKVKTQQALRDNDRSAKYCIREKIVLSDDELEKFTNDFKRTYDFITPHRIHLDMNKYYEYVCLEVSSLQSDFVILANTSGYSYARNVAIIDKK